MAEYDTTDGLQKYIEVYLIIYILTKIELLQLFNVTQEILNCLKLVYP